MKATPRADGKEKSGIVDMEGGLKRIAKLEAQLNADPSDPNPLLPVLQLARNSYAEVVHKSVWALHRMFITLISQRRVAELESTRSDEADDVKVWAKERLDEYIQILGGLLRDQEEALRASGLKLLFALLPACSAAVSGPNRKILHMPLLRLIITALLDPKPSLRGARVRDSSSASSSSDQSSWNIKADHQVELEDGVLPSDVAELVVDEYWAKYDDIRWAFFREAGRMIQAGEVRIAQPDNILTQLLPLTNLPKKADDINAFFVPLFNEKPTAAESVKPSGNKKAKKGAKGQKEVDVAPSWMDFYDESGSEGEESAAGGKKRKMRTSHLSIHASIYSVAAHSTAYTALWEAVMWTVPLDETWTRRILVGLHGSKGILSHMKEERRVRVADWLGGLVDRGGVVALLAMNGLFVLMTQYNLDYPNFYQRLYALLDAEVLHIRYRARFFRLLDTFLRSSLLSASLVAAFIKRLSRLALTAPPAGVILVIPFIYNLFKRHPGCMVMLQRLPDDDDAEFKDPYDPEEIIPAASKAIDSSCWELSAYQKHYFNQVATVGKIFSETFTQQEYNMEDFLDHGYNTLFESQIARKVRSAPALAMELELEVAVPVKGDLIFPSKSADEDVRATGDVVAQLWAF